MLPVDVLARLVAGELEIGARDGGDVGLAPFFVPGGRETDRAESAEARLAQLVDPRGFPRQRPVIQASEALDSFFG